MIQQITNARISTVTIVDPTGVSIKIDARIPSAEVSTEYTAAKTVTERKLLNSRIADSAGKITSAEI